MVKRGPGRPRKDTNSNQGTSKGADSKRSRTSNIPDSEDDVQIKDWFGRQRHLKSQNQFTTAMKTFFRTRQFLEKTDKVLESESGGGWKKISNWLQNKRRNTLESFLKKEISVLSNEMDIFERLYEKYDNPTHEDNRPLEIKDIPLLNSSREGDQKPPVVNHIQNTFDDFPDETKNVPRFVPAPGYRSSVPRFVPCPGYRDQSEEPRDDVEGEYQFTKILKKKYISMIVI
ncbi:hypothetical protein L3Y34_011146 [Caenorhabditis briggsae]|uniref:Uncharacterized protein n=1 Tax=Caenorhabditis briggsae TaxID=6238 RepID=A0AAE9CUM4_CAEBR|nr:hypothetical protein L3Y34_011146 [Caenorhabditis briggsae]